MFMVIKMDRVREKRTEPLSGLETNGFAMHKNGPPLLTLRIVPMKWLTPRRNSSTRPRCPQRRRI
jgi:hypothetical protein